LLRYFLWALRPDCPPRDNSGVFGAKQAAAFNRPFADALGWACGGSTGRPHPEPLPAVGGEGFKKKAKGPTEDVAAAGSIDGPHLIPSLNEFVLGGLLAHPCLSS
jgi:hypothetical protein